MSTKKLLTSQSSNISWENDAITFQLSRILHFNTGLLAHARIYQLTLYTAYLKYKFTKKKVFVITVDLSEERPLDFLPCIVVAVLDKRITFIEKSNHANVPRKCLEASITGNRGDLELYVENNEFVAPKHVVSVAITQFEELWSRD